jgi:hypothetical protein
LIAVTKTSTNAAPGDGWRSAETRRR